MQEAWIWPLVGGTETCPSGVFKIFKIKKKKQKNNFIRFPRYLLQFAINLKGSVVHLVESSWENISKPCELHNQSSLLGSSLGWGRSFITSETKGPNLLINDLVVPEIGFIPGSKALWGMPPTASKLYSISL